MTSTKRARAAWRFSRQLLAALILVTAVAFLGVGLEHSRLSNIVAPHVPVVVRAVRRNVRSETIIHLGSGPPPNLAGWVPVVQLLGLMAAIALVVATADTVQRASRRP
jgi:hypothetical protein